MGRGRALKTMQLEQFCYDVAAERQPLTVRSVGYCAFNAGMILDTSKNSMQKISRVLTLAREEGVIPWSWIVDETRELEIVPAWSDPVAYRETVSRSYRKDFWEQQPHECEVWSEKGSVRGILKPVLDTFGVGFRVMHGFSSATVVKQVANRTRHLDAPLKVFYLGDWDCSGKYMVEVDLPARLAEYGAKVELIPLAMTADDLTHPDVRATVFPAKKQDPRYAWFTERYRTSCWELDALNPVTVRERVKRAISDLIDWDAWRHDADLERAQLDSLEEVLSAWAGLAGG
jgi:hypothetical protein